jgi:hypothetical protein
MVELEYDNIRSHFCLRLFSSFVWLTEIWEGRLVDDSLFDRQTLQLSNPPRDENCLHWSDGIHDPVVDNEYTSLRS